jgi:hypothetical protein
MDDYREVPVTRQMATAVCLVIADLVDGDPAALVTQTRTLILDYGDAHGVTVMVSVRVATTVPPTFAVTVAC